MRLPLLLLLSTLLLQVSVDAFFYFLALRQRPQSRWPKWMFWQGAFFLLYMVVFVLMPKRGDNDLLLHISMWMGFIYISIYFPKILIALISLVGLALRRFGLQRKITILGAMAGLLLFVGMWYGALVHRYALKVNELDVKVEALPESFDGYRIAQISDLHVGTFGSDTTFVASLVAQVNQLEPDLIVFTGDLVNRRSAELLPFVNTLRQLSAPDGVLAVLGNHDYGQYYNWDTEADRLSDVEQLMDYMIDMDWELLTNSTITIPGQHPSDSLVVIGVENWGEPPFPSYGDLDVAYSLVNPASTKILLTHNPVHWAKHVAPNDTLKIDLTLSGHTHAMQMALGSVSPAALRYPQWGGLYQSPDGKRPLYVNIGSGTVALPMRLGATPEITLFTLRKK